MAPAAADVVCGPVSSAKMVVEYPRSARRTAQVKPETPAPMIPIGSCMPTSQTGATGDVKPSSDSSRLRFGVRRLFAALECSEDTADEFALSVSARSQSSGHQYGHRSRGRGTNDSSAGCRCHFVRSPKRKREMQIWDELLSL